MLSKLKNSKKYKADLDKFTKGISKIKKTSVQKEYKKTLEAFQLQCELIDNAHSPEFNGFIKPKHAKENIIEMVKLRIKLEKYLNDA